ncbi:hypothetical protein [Kitasatospora atroaurantiaca]|uniref:Peptidase inhibitor family I36 n=1 Tax=Kitasatospora atroaurantiaca TaxID=285545 RepID=A0A561EIP6_9ACTN|nr:hypothetical protein [Kitasatospora atroaurantiaca]TWE15496.1 hypothetical protein FB465_0393 [Kitasatospora atroaurantiaca]
MRLRNTVAAAVAAFALVLSAPGPALAADGEFTYTYLDEDGTARVGLLIDPESRECVNLPEADSDELPSAYAPKNRTGATATVFTAIDCDGDYYSLRPGGGASDRLKLRSVVFS